MSKKISAASAIQGNFSASALQNMMGTEDPQIALAKKLTTGASIDEGVDVESLLAQTRHNIISYSESIEYAGKEPLLYQEVMGDATEEVVTVVETTPSEKKVTATAKTPLFAFTFNNPFANMFAKPVSSKSKKSSKKSRKNVLNTFDSMASIASDDASFGFGTFGF